MFLVGNAPPDLALRDGVRALVLFLLDFDPLELLVVVVLFCYLELADDVVALEIQVGQFQTLGVTLLHYFEYFKF